MPQHTRPRKENGCIITSAFSVKTGTYEGDPVLVFADIIAVILRSRADCREIIRAVALIEADMPPDEPPPDETAYIDYPAPHSDDCDCEDCVTFYAGRNPPDIPPADRCVSRDCGHLATDHFSETPHPCNVCDCTEYRWMPDEPVSLWHSLTGPARAGNPDGAA